MSCSSIWTSINILKKSYGTISFITEYMKLIKIDTEGAEGAVLKGAVTSLSNLEIPYVICEINRFGLKQMGSTEKELRDFMRELGYDPYLISDQSPHLQKLAPDFFVNSIYVFNLLFSKNNPLETDSFKNNV